MKFQETKNGRLFRLAAFADGAKGGNPAGVWIGAELPSPADMQSIAAEVGYSETAFVAPATGVDRIIRYYSPEAEVSFCGHATIATGVVLGREHGEDTYTLSSTVGLVPVTARIRHGRIEATLRSVDTRNEPPARTLLDNALKTLGWRANDLDPSIPAAKAYAGAWHLVLAVRDADRLATLEYDFDVLRTIMLREQLTTLQLVWKENDDSFHSRNPFPVGGVVEDPATGAAAAAFGGYLRDSGIVVAPFQFRIRQGVAMGRPSILEVAVPAEGGVSVTGNAIEL